MYQQESPRLALNGINPRFNIGRMVDNTALGGLLDSYREVRFLTYHKLNKLNNMSELKELLEATVKGLEEKINDLTFDLRSKQKELEDVSKPEMTSEIYDILHELVEEGIDNYDFNDGDNYTFEYELDYDGKINTHSVEFESAHHLGESIMNKIDSHFKISTSEDIK